MYEVGKKPKETIFTMRNGYVKSKTKSMKWTEQGAGGVQPVRYSIYIVIDSKSNEMAYNVIDDNLEFISRGKGGLVMMNDVQNGTHFYGYDGNGNVSALVSASNGEVTANYEYGPFGEPTRVSGVMSRENPFRFSTKRTVDSIDIILYEYRAYSSTIGIWLNRDPIGELGGKNLYGFVINNSLNQVDLFGLVGCTLSYSFDDDDSWWEKPLYPINTKWLKTFDEIKKDIKEQLKTCCCIKKIYFTQHNGVPGTLVIGSGQLKAKELQIIVSAINDTKRQRIIEANKRALDFLKFVKTFMCNGGKIYFVQCYAGKGPEGEELKKWLQNLLGPNIDIVLYANGVKWFWGTPYECEVKVK